MIDLGSDQPSPSAAGRPGAPLRGFVPRAAALQQGKAQPGGGAPVAAAGGEAPKSNDEFRQMFLSKK